MPLKYNLPIDVLPPKSRVQGSYSIKKKKKKQHLNWQNQESTVSLTSFTERIPSYSHEWKLQYYLLRKLSQTKVWEKKKK